jgi:hypothetical protein
MSNEAELSTIGAPWRGNAVGFELVVHHTGRDIQVGSGILLHPVRALQCLQQSFAFDVFERDTMGWQSDNAPLRHPGTWPAFTQAETSDAHRLSVLLRHAVRDHTFQFAQVPWPRVIHEHLLGPLIEAFDGTAKHATVALQKEVGEGQNVLKAVAQGGHLDANRVEPRIQICAKTLGSDGFGQVVTGGRNDADIGVDGPGGTEALERPLLEHAQELQLNPRADIANLMQEERPLIRVFEATNASGLSPWEGAPLVAKELAFQGSFGQRGAVHRDQGLVTARAVSVNGGRQQSLASSGLSHNQHVGTGGDLLLKTTEDMSQMHTMPDNPFALAYVRLHAPQIMDSLQRPTALKRPFDAEMNLFQTGKLLFDQKIMGAQLQSLESARHVIGVGEHEHWRQLFIGLRGLKDLKPIFPGEAEVGKDDFEEALLDLLNGLIATAGLGHTVSLLAEAIGDACA